VTCGAGLAGAGAVPYLGPVRRIEVRVLATEIEQLIPRIIAAAVFLLVGFPIHEYAHARTALHYGDGTAKLFGRVTLDPRSHFDPAGGMILVISTLAAGLPIGWAKPTPVNPAMLRGGRRSHALVSLAGPASNFVMALVAALAVRAFVAFDVPASDIAVLAYQVVATFLVINVALFVFNLIPAPPLDGASVLVGLLRPPYAMRVGMFLDRYGSWILMALIGLAILPALFPEASGLPNPLGDLVNGLVRLLVGA
jgi:Zn-dependent protease